MELTLEEIARLVGAELQGDPGLTIRALALIQHAGPEDLTYLDGLHDPELLRRTRAAAIIAPPGSSPTRSGQALLLSGAPHRAFLDVSRELWRRHAFPPPGIHATATIDPSAELGEDVSVGPNCVVGAQAEIADHVALHAASVIAPGARIGAHTVIGARAYVGPFTRIGARCVIHPGATVGYAYCPGQSSDGMPTYFGGVIIEDDVELGPNSAIEDGETVPTRIARGAHVGALSMVGHDSIIGRGARLAAMVGVAGGAEIGDNAVLFGQVGVSNGARVGEHAVVLAKSGVSGYIPPRAVFFGIPARPRDEFLKSMAAAIRLPRLLKRWKAVSGGADKTESD